MTRDQQREKNMKARTVWKSWLRIAATLGAMLGMTVAVTACGGDDSASNSSTTTSSGQAATSGASDGEPDYDAMLAGLYEGTYREPSGPVLDKPAAGKDVWVVANGMNAESSANVAAGVQEAGKKLGWNVKVFDSRFEPTRMLSGVQQAVAAGADGIVTIYIDCSAVKNGLAQAKKAGIPTINVDAGECDTPSFTTSVQYPGFEDYEAFIRAWAGGQAAYAVAKTKGKAKVIMNTGTDLAVTRIGSKGAYDELKKCSGCEVVGDAEFVSADFGPPLQSKISQQLLKHPEADVFIASYDAVLTSGGAQAIKSSGRQDELLVVGGEGSAEGIKLIAGNGGMDACSGTPTEMQGYATVNYLAVLFAGKSLDDVDNGIGIQICDKDHNLPPAGQGFQAPLDYKATYDRLWSLK